MVRLILISFYMNEQTWSSECIEVLQHMATKSSSLRWLHNESSHHYRHVNHRFIYGTISLSSIASAFSFTSADTNKFGPYMNYAVGALNIILAMMASIQRFLMAAEKAHTHGQYSNDYGTLVRKIQLELVLKRLNSHDILTEVSNNYSKLSENAPYIPHKIIDRYLVQFPDITIKPEVVEGFFNESKKNDGTQSGWKKILTLIHNKKENQSDKSKNSSLSKDIEKDKLVSMNTVSMKDVVIN